MPGKKRYPGSRPFTPDYSHLFFGRDEDIGKLSRFINAERLSVLYGKSGLGKSSLLNAGVIPKLKNEGYVHVPVRFGSFSIEDSILMPLDVMAQAIIKEAPEKNYLEAIESEDISLWQHLKGIQYEHKDKPSILLVLDQFEELFTYPEEEYRAFAATLAKLLNGQMPRRFKRNLRRRVGENEDLISEEDWAWMDRPVDLHVVLAIRSDKLSLLNKLTDSIPNILLNCYELMPLTSEQAGEAIVEPALLEGDFASEKFDYDKETVDKMLDYLTQEGSRNIESFQLQILCQYVEERLVIDRGLSMICSDDLGELASVYQDYYDLHISDLPSREERRAARLLIEDGLIFEEDQRRISLYEGQIMAQYSISNELLEKLVDTHLIRSELHSSGGRYYEISHDSLVKPILRSRERRIAAEKRLQRQKKEEARKEEEAARSARRRRRIFVGALLSLLSIIGLVIYSSYLQNKNAQIAEAEARAVAVKDSLAIVVHKSDSLLIEMQKLIDTNDTLFLNLLDRTSLLKKEKERAESNFRLLQAAQALSEANRNSYAMVVNAVRQEDKDPQLALGLALASLDFSNTNTNALAIAEQIFGRNTLYKQKLGGKGGLDGVALAPNGERLVTLSKKTGIAVWDINGAPLFKLEGDGHAFTAGSITPDSKYLITGDEEGHVHQIDLTTGEEIAEFNHQVINEPIRHIAISPGDDQHFLLVSSGMATEYRIGKKEPIRFFPKDGGDYTIAKYSPDGTQMAIGDEKGYVLIFDKTTSENWRATLSYGEITSLAFSHDHKELLCGSIYPNAIHYDLVNRKIWPPLETGNNGVVAVAFTEDDTRILTWTKNNEGQIWSRRGKLLDRIEEPDKTTIRTAEFSPNGDFIVLGDDKDARVRAVYRSFLMELADHNNQRIQSLAFSPGNKSIATGGWDGTVQFWNIDDGLTQVTYEHSLENNRSSKDINAVAFSPTGKFLASASDEGSVYIRNARNGDSIAAVLLSKRYKVHSLAFSQDESMLYAGMENGDVKTIDLRGIQDLDNIKKVKTDKLWSGISSVYGLRVAPGGKFIAASMRNGKVMIAQLSPFKVLKNFQAHQAPVPSLAFSVDGIYLISVGQDDSKIRIWDWQEGKGLKDVKMRQEISDHTGHINVVDFSANGLFITGSSDKTAILWKWDIAKRKALPQRVLTRPEQPIFSAAFSPDGRYFALGYSNGKARLYQTRSLREVYSQIAPPLSPAQRARFGITINPDGVKDAENAGAILEYANFLSTQAAVQADSTARRLLSTSTDLYYHLLTEQSRRASLLNLTRMKYAYESYLVRLIKLGEKREIRKWLIEQQALNDPSSEGTYELALPIQHVMATGQLYLARPDQALKVFNQLPNEEAKASFFTAMDSLLHIIDEEGEEIRGAEKFMVNIQESMLLLKEKAVRNKVADFIQNRATQVDRTKSFEQAISIYEKGGFIDPSGRILLKVYLDYSRSLIENGDYATMIEFGKTKMAEVRPGTVSLVPDMVMAYILQLRYADAMSLYQRYADVDLPEDVLELCKDRNWAGYSMKSATRSNLIYWKEGMGEDLDPSAAYHIDEMLNYLK